MDNLNSIDTLDFSEIANNLLDVLYKNYKGNLTEDQMAVSSALEKSIKELDSLIKYTEVEQRNDSLFYRTEAGWNEVLYKRQENATDIRLFQVCTEILSLLRNNAILDQDIVIYSQTRGGGLKVYYGKESNLPTMRETDGKTKSDWGQQVQYLLKGMEEQMVKAEKNSNFVNHYNKFKKIALGKVRETRSLNQKYAEKKYNMGHVIEAYQRHLFYNDNIKQIDSDTIENFIPCDKVTPRNVIINLWYSINSDPWYTGGDVGNLQVKGNNRTLASAISIREVASKLLYWIHNRTNFKKEDFDRMFTQGAVTDDFNAILKEMSGKTLNELVEQIGQKSQGRVKEPKS